MALRREGKGAVSTKVNKPLKKGNQCIIGPLRASYMNVFKHRMNTQRKVEEYSVTLLIEKGDKVLIDFFKAQGIEALKMTFGKVPPKYEPILLDGDEETDNDGNPKHPGYMFHNTRADLDQPPILIGPSREELDKSNAIEWVSGDWGNFKLDFFGYDYEGKKGVSSRLKAVQFKAKDEPFGSAPDDYDSVKDEFDDDDTVEQGGSFLD